MSQGRILYVHGAGTRAEQANSNAALLRTRLGLDGTPDRLATSSWGDVVGTDARLLEMDRVLPDYKPRALGLVGAGTTPTAVLPDAFAPLRAMAKGRTAATGVRPRDADALLAFLALGGVDMSAQGLPADRLSDAAREVAASPEYAAARGDAVALIDATAMSTLARAVERDPDAPARVGILGLDLGWLESRAGDLAASILGGGVSAVEAWVGPQLTPALSLWASKRIAPRRRAFMHDHILVVADVLRYQRHGEQIREHVRAEIQALDTPRMVIAHSLGGIIAVDTLFGPGASDLDVSLLVTFGSQSALLAAIDALDPVKPTVPWLNLWATYDFVSFLDAGLWPGVVEDREIVLDVGFPAAHGAYFESDELARQIRSHPAAAGIFA